MEEGREPRRMADDMLRNGKITGPLPAATRQRAIETLDVLQMLLASLESHDIYHYCVLKQWECIQMEKAASHREAFITWLDGMWRLRHVLVRDGLQTPLEKFDNLLVALLRESPLLPPVPVAHNKEWLLAIATAVLRHQPDAPSDVCGTDKVAHRLVNAAKDDSGRASGLK